MLSCIASMKQLYILSLTHVRFMGGDCLMKLLYVFEVECKTLREKRVIGDWMRSLQARWYRAMQKLYAKIHIRKNITNSLCRCGQRQNSKSN